MYDFRAVTKHPHRWLITAQIIIGVALIITGSLHPAFAKQPHPSEFHDGCFILTEHCEQNVPEVG